MRKVFNTQHATVYLLSWKVPSRSWDENLSKPGMPAATTAIWPHAIVSPPSSPAPRGEGKDRKEAYKGRGGVGRSTGMLA